MTYLIIGASSGLGRELAEEFAKNKKIFYSYQGTKEIY